MPKRLIDCALVSITLAHDALEIHRSDNDICLSGIASELQQTAELALKAILEENGFRVKGFGHSVSKCWNTVKSLVPNVFSDDIVEFLDMQAVVITQWEVIGRYPSDFSATIKALDNYYMWIAKIYNVAASYCGGTKFPISKSSSIKSMQFNFPKDGK